MLLTTEPSPQSLVHYLVFLMFNVLERREHNALFALFSLAFTFVSYCLGQIPCSLDEPQTCYAVEGVLELPVPRTYAIVSGLCGSGERTQAFMHSLSPQ